MSKETLSDSEASIEPGNSGNIYPLIALVVGIFIAGASISFVRMSGNNNITDQMTPILIAILSSFMPLTAISFLRYRLPRKQQEFQRFSELLAPGKQGQEFISFANISEYRGSDYFLPLLILAAGSALGFIILTNNEAEVLFKANSWAESAHGAESFSWRISIVSLGFAFLGSYIWSMQYIFRRMITLDLPPGAYYHVATRIIFSSFIVIVYSHFTYTSNPKSDAVGIASTLPAVAFITGMFPERMLNRIIEITNGIFGHSKIKAHDLSLDMIEGINEFHKSRLFELGIDNVQNLANASLVEVVIKTPFNPKMVVDWIAQSHLCLEVKSDTHLARGAGMRTIFDLIELGDADMLESVAADSSIELSRLNAIYFSNKNNASISRLREAYDNLNLV